MATILTKKKDTTGAPSAGDLTNSTGGAELAVNTADKRLYTKDSGGNVVEVGINPTSITTGTLNTSGAVVFNDAGADVDFRVEGDTDANLLFVDASTDRVGIGKNNPGRTLDVNGTIGSVRSGSTAAVLQVINDNNSWNIATGTSTSQFKIDNNLVGNALTIDSSNNVGIGTSSPGTKLEVAGSGFPFEINSTNSNGYKLNFSDNGTSRGYIGSSSTEILLVADGSVNEKMRITSGGYFKASNNGTYDGVAAAYHEFRTTNSGTETLLISNTSADPYGVFVGFSNDPNNATNTVYSAYTGATAIYRIFSNGTVAARSDAKWKKNIETTRDGYVDDLARLRVVKYNWYNHEDGTPKELGLIAQEVEEVFPGLVQTDEEITKEVRTREIPAVLDEDGNEIEPARTEEYTEKIGTGEYSKSIKFSVFTPMLIKAVQELKAITDTQAQTISALEARIAALENA